MYKGRMNLALFEARKAKGWTQKQAAEAGGISEGYYNQIENDVRPGSKLVLGRLANALGVHPGLFYSGADPELSRLLRNWHLLPREKRRNLSDLSQALLPGPASDSQDESEPDDPAQEAS